MDKIVKIAEEFYRDLYSGRENGRRIYSEELEIPPVKPEEVKYALDAMQRGKAAGGYLVTAYLLKDGGQIVLENLATLYTQYLMTSSVPESWKNANIILFHKKCDAKDLQNLQTDQLTVSCLQGFCKGNHQ